MHLLDTNHISILERRGPETQTLLDRLAVVPVSEVKVCVISYEEQIRGWAAALAQAKDAAAQVQLYQRLVEQLENYCNLSVLPFDDASAARYEELRKQHRRTSSSDLKIAAIALTNEAILLTQNLRDFQGIERLQAEDWTR